MPGMTISRAPWRETVNTATSSSGAGNSSERSGAPFASVRRPRLPALRTTIDPWCAPLLAVRWQRSKPDPFFAPLDVLGHEIGHHFDRQFRHKNGRNPLRRGREAFAELTSRRLQARLHRLSGLGH
jgi:hypothetical protein